MHRKIYYREFYYNMNIIKMFMNNVIILLLAVRICEDTDNRGLDKRGCTLLRYCPEAAWPLRERGILVNFGNYYN